MSTTGKGIIRLVLLSCIVGYYCFSVYKLNLSLAKDASIRSTEYVSEQKTVEKPGEIIFCINKNEWPQKELLLHELLEVQLRIQLDDNVNIEKFQNDSIKFYISAYGEGMNRNFNRLMNDDLLDTSVFSFSDLLKHYETEIGLIYNIPNENTCLKIKITSLRDELPRMNLDINAIPYHFSDFSLYLEPILTIIVYVFSGIVLLILILMEIIPLIWRKRSNLS